MTAPLPQRPPLQTCPLCGLAMIAHRSRPDAACYDLYRCLACDTELRLSGAGQQDAMPRGRHST